MTKIKINGRILEFPEDNITLDLIDCRSLCLGEGASEKVAFNFNITGNVNIVGNFYNSGDFQINGDLINDGGFYNSGQINIGGKFNKSKKPRNKKEVPIYAPNYATVTLKGKSIKVPSSQR